MKVNTVTAFFLNPIFLWKTMTFLQKPLPAVGAASQCFWDELMLLKCELMLLKSKINTNKSANIVLIALGHTLKCGQNSGLKNLQTEKSWS